MWMAGDIRRVCSTSSLRLGQRATGTFLCWQWNPPEPMWRHLGVPRRVRWGAGSPALTATSHDRTPAIANWWRERRLLRDARSRVLVVSRSIARPSRVHRADAAKHGGRRRSHNAVTRESRSPWAA